MRLHPVDYCYLWYICGSSCALPALRPVCAVPCARYSHKVLRYERNPGVYGAPAIRHHFSDLTTCGSVPPRAQPLLRSRGEKPPKQRHNVSATLYYYLLPTTATTIRELLRDALAQKIRGDCLPLSLSSHCPATPTKHLPTFLPSFSPIADGVCNRRETRSGRGQGAGHSMPFDSTGSQNRINSWSKSHHAVTCNAPPIRNPQWQPRSFSFATLWLAHLTLLPLVQHLYTRSTSILVVGALGILETISVTTP